MGRPSLSIREWLREFTPPAPTALTRRSRLRHIEVRYPYFEGSSRWFVGADSKGTPLILRRVPSAYRDALEVVSMKRRKVRGALQPIGVGASRSDIYLLFAYADGLTLAQLCSVLRSHAMVVPAAVCIEVLVSLIDTLREMRRLGRPFRLPSLASVMVQLNGETLFWGERFTALDSVTLSDRRDAEVFLREPLRADPDDTLVSRFLSRPTSSSDADAYGTDDEDDLVYTIGRLGLELIGGGLPFPAATLRERDSVNQIVAFSTQLAWGPRELVSALAAACSPTPSGTHSLVALRHELLDLREEDGASKMKVLACAALADIVGTECTLSHWEASPVVEKDDITPTRPIP